MKKVGWQERRWAGNGVHHVENVLAFSGRRNELSKIWKDRKLNETKNADHYGCAGQVASESSLLSWCHLFERRSTCGGMMCCGLAACLATGFHPER